jgi:DNA-binding response OmpR family regulator
MRPLNMKMIKRILIVDDEKGFRDILRSGLIDRGYHVDTAESGVEAIRRIRELPFDVVLTDYMMPGINGLETFRKIKNLQSNIIVAMMTALRYMDDVHIGLDEGLAACFYKPFKFKEIQNFIENTP